MAEELEDIGGFVGVAKSTVQRERLVIVADGARRSSRSADVRKTGYKDPARCRITAHRSGALDTAATTRSANDGGGDQDLAERLLYLVQRPRSPRFSFSSSTICS
jgi:hypothetical protein